MRHRIFEVVRRACHAGVLGFRYPTDFSTRSCVRWRMHRHEWATLNYLRAALSTADVFVDVGAHVGYHSATIGRVVGPRGFVYAFEPHPGNYRLLCQNCRHLPQIKPLQMAVSSLCGETSLFLHATSSSSHALVDLSCSGKSVPVMTTTLDSWARTNHIDKVDAVLIDVEGHELSVLRGMRGIVSNNPRIKIIVEYCPSNWVSENSDIGALIKGIHDMRMRVVCALGQTERYAIPPHKVRQDVVAALSLILEKEAKKEDVNYVNIVISRGDGTCAHCI